MKVPVPSMPLRLTSCAVGSAASKPLMVVTYRSMSEALLQQGWDAPRRPEAETESGPVGGHGQTVLPSATWLP